jgi:hypothetical protein
VRSPFEWLGGLRGAGIVWPDDPHLRALWDYSVLFTTKPSMYASFPLIDIVAECAAHRRAHPGRSHDLGNARF